MTMSNSLRKIYVNGRFLRGSITGTSRVAEEVLTCWDKAIQSGDPRFSGYAIEVLCPTDSIRSLDLEGIKLRKRDLFGGRLWEMIDLGLLARDGTLINFANIAPLVHTRSITYLHDAQVFLFPESYPRNERLIHQKLAKLAGRMARQVITVSQFSSEMLQRFRIARASKIAVVHNGAEHLLRTPPDHSVLESFGLVPYGYVLMLGSSFAYKNTEVIYEAFSRMERPRPKLAVVARADLRKTLKIAADLGDDFVTLSGISDGQLRALYDNALVFVQPAKTEGFAMTQLEALNAGSPVITTPYGSMREVLGDDVVYVDSDSPVAWRDAILRFRDEPGRRASKLALGQAMAAKYTWQRTSDALWQKVTEVAAS